MTTTGMLVAGALAAVVGVALVVTGLGQARPSVATAVHRVREVGAVDPESAASRRVGPLVAIARRRPGALPSDVELRLVGRTAEQHVLALVGASVGGAAGVVVIAALLGFGGLIPLAIPIPVGFALAAGVLGPLLVHARVVEQAATVRTDLRHQLSAYLDVVTMLLAGNMGHEGAIEVAAGAGDGRLFAELRRRTREVAASGRSLVEALHLAGVELGVVELEQVAATTALSAAEGAPVARSLAATCASLRSTLATEQETEARLRTARLTAPIVGMALVFMALVVYPALGAA
jgi:Flp pilus assembly protein TadB